MVKIISSRCQEFLGIRYYLCGWYFQRKDTRLHRMVWECAYGNIPDKWHIHHRDGNRSNNQLENLEMVRQADHLSYHAKQRERSGYPPLAQIKAKKWHASEAGRKWHSEHAKKNVLALWENPAKKLCQICGKDYTTPRAYAHKSIYCSPVCSQESMRRRRAKREGRRYVSKRPKR